MRSFYTLSALLASSLAFGQAPTTAPTAPDRDAETVISIYSDEYEDVTVDTYSAEFSSATFSEVTIADNQVLLYDMLSFAGIEMLGENALDLMAAGITTLHFDYWSPNSTVLRVKLVDFAGDGYNEPGGNDTEATVGRSLPMGEWVSVDLPIGLFTGMNMTDINQLIISSDPAGESTVYLDNIYFYSGGETIGGTPLDLPVTFEEEDVTYGLSDFGGAVSQLVEDPTDAENTVVETTKTAGAETYAGTTLTLNLGGSPNDPGFATPIPFTADATTMMVRVWSPTAGTPVRLKVESSTDPTVSVETETMTEMAMMWDTLVFDFANEATGTAALNLSARYNKASIFFDFGTQPTEAATYYWDDVMFGGASTGGGGGGDMVMPTVAAPVPTYAADSVLSLFSDVYEDVTVDTWRTDWSAANYSETTIEDDNVKVYAQLDNVGIETVGDNALDVSGYDFFHLDYWTADLDTFRVKLVDFGMDGYNGPDSNDSEDELAFKVTQGEWVSLDIPVGDFTGMNLTDINQLILSGVPAGAGTVYIDNVFFYNAATTSSREPQVGLVSAYPNPVTQRVLLTAPARMQRVVLFDAGGRVVAEYQPETEQYEVDMARLKAGLYVALVTTPEGQLTVKLRKQ